MTPRCKNLPQCTQFPRNVRLSHRESRLFWRVVTFLIIAPYKYSYLLTDRMSFFLININGISVENTCKPRDAL